MQKQQFRVLDVVRISSHGSLVTAGVAGKEAVVTLIRDMDDGTYRYEVISRTREGDETVSGIYLSDDLAATGERASVEEVSFLPRGMRPGDVATVAIDYPEYELAGKRVELSATVTEDEEGGHLIGVWCPDIDEYLYLPGGVLHLTGEWLPPAPTGRRVGSLQVNEEGKVLVSRV